MIDKPHEIKQISGKKGGGGGAESGGRAPLAPSTPTSLNIVDFIGD